MIILELNTTIKLNKMVALYNNQIKHTVQSKSPSTYINLQHSTLIKRNQYGNSWNAVQIDEHLVWQIGLY